MERLLVAIALAAHGLVHLGFLSPRPAPAPGAPPWPFDLGGSRLLRSMGVDETAARLVGRALVGAVILAYGAAGLAALGALPATLFGPAVILGSVASLALLVTFFHPWLVVGIALDAALLWAILAARWDGPTA